MKLKLTKSDEPAELRAARKSKWLREPPGQVAQSIKAGNASVADLRREVAELAEIVALLAQRTL